MALDPRIEAIRVAYDLDKTDFWELPQKKGTWVAKHSALEVAAAKAGIRFDLPTILEAHGGEGVAAVCVQGQMGDRFAWSIGEASPKNNKNAYPWAMAEKRAVDRVVLKLLGIHGLLYSEEEADDFKARPSEPAPTAAPANANPPPKPMLQAEKRALWGELRDELNACESVELLDILAGSAKFRAEAEKLKDGDREFLREHYVTLRADWVARAEHADRLRQAGALQG